MRALLAGLLVACATAAHAQERTTDSALYSKGCVVEVPSRTEVRVRCGEGSAGRRVTNAVQALTYGRVPSKLWLGKGWRGRAVTPPFTPELAPAEDPGLVAAEPARDVPVGDTIQIDVMIVWTQASENAFGGAAHTLAQVNAAVASMNQSLANSQLGYITYRLVEARKVSYVENTTTSPLTWLYYSVNGFAQATVNPDVTLKAVRAAAGADQVQIFAAINACGQGYAPSSGAATALSHADPSCAVGNLTFAHELGHNFGCQHDPVSQCGAAVCPGYNYGHRFGSGRTVLAYPDGSPRLPYFSNPNVLYNGVPTGIANQRDNALVIAQNAARIAAFLPSAGRHPARPVGGRIVPTN